MKLCKISRIYFRIFVCLVCLCTMPFLVLAGGGGTAGSKAGNRVVVIKNISPAPAGFVPALVAIPTVEVGDAGNAAINLPLSGTNVVVGAVSSPFRIGVNEVAVSQYATFLNAVASVTNSNNSSVVASLYPAALMGSPANVSGISRTGAGTTASPFVYSPSGNANHPMAYASWFSAARFANWMHNGATNGADTESGAYTLAGKTNDGTGIVRSAGVRWWIPSEDEWFKAAYYKGGGAASGYHLFPTKSDSVPRNNDPTATNQANFRRFGQTYCVTQTNTFDPAQNYLTPCGFFNNSPSPYGTFDQGGNLDEWTETAVQAFFGNARVTRGGSWNTSGLNNNSDPRSISLPKDAINTVGFRLASSASTTGGGGLNNSVLLGIVSRSNETQLVLPGQVVSMTVSSGEFTVFARALHSDPSQVGPETSFTPLAGQSFRTFLSVLVANGGIVIEPFDFTPKLDAIVGRTIPEDSALQTIPLSGIAALGADGLPELPDRSVRVTALSSAPSIIPNPSLTYQSPNSTGSLAFRPIADASGSSVINVSVENVGLDQNLETAQDNIRFTRSFIVTVTPVNDPPDLKPLGNILFSGRNTQETIQLSGITAGGGEDQPLRITSSSSNTNIVPNPVVTYISPQTTGSLRVSRIAGRSGLVPMTIRVEDGGLDQNLATPSDNRSVTREFTAIVR
jgi:formylglycine-generating enzyme required for sulfatase activity